MKWFGKKPKRRGPGGNNKPDLRPVFSLAVLPRFILSDRLILQSAQFLHIIPIQIPINNSVESNEGKIWSEMKP